MKIAVCSGHPTLAKSIAVTLVAAMVLTGSIPATVAPGVVFASDVTPPPAPPTVTPITGFIDSHLHQFANLGLGGLEVWGSPVDPRLDPTAPLQEARARALPDSDFMYVTVAQFATLRGPGNGPVPASFGTFPQCPNAPGDCWRVTIHGTDGGSDLLNTAVMGSSHGTNGYRASGSSDPGMQWSAWNVVTTQQAYWEWLNRARQHGLKMITMHALNSSTLCDLGPGISSFGCDDDSAVVRQITAAKALEAYIDAKSGGPGQGFYRIVYTGDEARDVIRQGKLAVVLGVEVDTPKECIAAADCSGKVSDLVQQYYDMGIRVVYPVHLVDNAFGGTALYSSLFELNNYVVNGSFFNVTTVCAPGDSMPLFWRSDIRDALTPGLKLAVAVTLPAAFLAIATALALGVGLGGALSGLFALIGPLVAALPLIGLLVTVAGISPSILDLLVNVVGAMFVQLGPVGAPPAPNCNTRPLTPTGIALVNALMDHRMLIDIDHSDRLVVDQILTIAEGRHYPGIVAGHTGLVGANRTDTPSGSSGRHENSKTDATVQRIADLGGFISLHSHQGDRSRLRDISTSDSVAFDCGNSSQAWAQMYLYATRDLGLTGVGIGTDMNGFSGTIAPRYGPGACGGDHDPGYAPAPLGGVKYRPFLVDYEGNALLQYQFGNKLWNYNTDGLAHVGLLPDFVADLQAIGLTDDDLRPLFNSVEAYVRMWEKMGDDQAPTVTCGTVGEDWHAGDVSVPCNAYDLGYGLKNAGDASFSLATAVPAGVETGDATTSAHVPICDLASTAHCANVDAIAGINVDKKAPTVTVTSPAAGVPAYVVGQNVLASYGCTDGGSGLNTCAGTVANDAALDTSVGPHPFVVNSSDNVGNTAAVSHPYNVAFALCLLYDTTKAAKSGSTIPIKLQLCNAGGSNLSSQSIVLTATGVTQISTTASGALLDDAGNANPDNQFRYDAGLGGYVFNLKTTGFGTGTYALSFTASGDPTTHTALFQVR